jgi:hypothetical protein
MAAVTRSSSASSSEVKKKAGVKAKKPPPKAVKATAGKTVKKSVKKSAAKAARKRATATGRTRTPGRTTAIPADERERMIRERAYLRAERRGFSGGDALEDWLEAEAEVDRLLSDG